MFSGWCFWRLALLIAVSIWREMQSSANALKGSFLSDVEIPDRLEETDHPFLDDIFFLGTGEEIGPGLGTGEIAVAVEEDLDASLVTISDAGDQIVVFQRAQAHVLGLHIHFPLKKGPLVTNARSPSAVAAIRLFVLFCVNNGSIG